MLNRSTYQENVLKLFDFFNTLKANEAIRQNILTKITELCRIASFEINNYYLCISIN